MEGWGEKARRAISRFFRQWNDIDVYVEDTDRGAVKFYSELLNRLCEGRFRIERVFPLGGKPQVLNACAVDQSAGGRPRLYIIDGDLDLLLGTPHPGHRRLHRLNVYCIENYLMDEEAILDLLYEEDQTKSRSDLATQLKFSAWVQAIVPSLLELFIIYALMRKHLPNQRSVSQRIHSFLLVQGRSRICSNKIKTERTLRLAEMGKRTTLTSLRQDEEEIKRRAQSRPNPLDFVSGKDFLIPLIHMRAKEICGQSIPFNKIKFRLARRCNLDSMADLSRALERASRSP